MLGILWWTSIPSRGSCDAPCHFMLGVLWWTSIPSRGSCDAPCHFMLGIPWWTSISSQGGSGNTPSHFMLGMLWWTSIPFRRSCDAPSCVMLRKPELSVGLGLMSLMVHSIKQIGTWPYLLITLCNPSCIKPHPPQFDPCLCYSALCHLFSDILLFLQRLNKML